MPIQSLAIICVVSSAFLLGCGPKSLNAADRAFCSEHNSEGEDLPLHRVAPRYPHGVAEKGIEGWVEIAAEINPGGTLSKVRVIEFAPQGVFDRAAIKAVSKWRYCPPTDKNAPNRPIKTKLNFDLVPVSTGPPPNKGTAAVTKQLSPIV
jgi:TonB family protein